MNNKAKTIAESQEYIPELYLAILLFFAYTKGTTVEYFKYPTGFHNWVYKASYKHHIKQPGDSYCDCGCVRYMDRDKECIEQPCGGYSCKEDYNAEIVDKDELQKRLERYIKSFEKNDLDPYEENYNLYEPNIKECTEKWQMQYEKFGKSEGRGKSLLISFPQDKPSLLECHTLFSLSRKKGLVEILNIAPYQKRDYEKMIFTVKFLKPPREIYNTHKFQNPHDDEVVIDEKSRTIRYNGRNIKIKSNTNEFKLLCYLMKDENIGKSIPTDEIRDLLQYSKATDMEDYTLDNIRSLIKVIKEKFLPDEPFETSVKKEYVSVLLKK